MSLKLLSGYRTGVGVQTEDGRRWRRTIYQGRKWYWPLHCGDRGMVMVVTGGGVSQGKGQDLIILEKWDGLALDTDARTGHPSSRGGANEAWAPEKERAQIARQRHAGRGEVRRGRWCGWLTLLCASHHSNSCYNREQYRLKSLSSSFVFLTLFCVFFFFLNFL